MDRNAAAEAAAAVSHIHLKMPDRRNGNVIVDQRSIVDLRTGRQRRTAASQGSVVTCIELRVAIRLKTGTD